MSLYFTEEEYQAYLQRLARNQTDDELRRIAQNARAALQEALAGENGQKGQQGKRLEEQLREQPKDQDKEQPKERSKSRKTKYGNRRTECDGHTFDSAHEADIYRELQLRVKAGELKCVLRQVPFDLPGGIRYFADFVTIAPDMTIEGVYDAKSEATKRDKVYIIKRKQVLALYGIEIKEV